MADRPNFLLFMPETLRADAVFGPRDRRAQTPNMDRLAAEGAAFTNCHAQMAFCSPSRCGMFTGWYPHTAGHRSLLSLLQPGERNLFRDLKDAGYRTAAFGKNDLLAAQSVSLCFDEVKLRVAPEPREATDPSPPPEDSPWRRTFYQGRRVGGEAHDRDWACVRSALQFLDEPQSRPFCLYLPLSFVHPPYRVEEPFFSLHDAASVPDPIPGELGGKRTYIRELHRAYGLDRFSTEQLKEIKRVYFGMTSRVDHQLGQLIDKLKERGLYDNTVIVVFSDHGDYAGDYAMVEKFLAGFEDCLLHVPLILHGPGVERIQPRDGLCEMTDLYPTLLELAGVQSQHYHFGRSLGPALHGETDDHRDAVFAEGGHHPDEQEHFHVKLSPGSPYYWRMYEIMKRNPVVPARAAMVRTSRWKYVYSPDDRNELFDLRTDPRELVNLADREDHRDTVAALRERLLRWMVHTSDVLPPRRDPRGWPR